MSTTSTTTDANQNTSAPSASSTSQSDTDTATLYLFTFLATILILVLLSASLVLRSYILRRRYRRRIQQVSDTLFVDFDNGPFNSNQFDPMGARRFNRRFGPKPALWDVWIHPVDHDAWSTFVPVAARSNLSSVSTTSIPGQSTLTPFALPPPSDQPSLISRFRLRSPFLRPSRVSPFVQTRSSSSQSPPSSKPMSPCPSAQSEKGAGSLSVCVLVAMPDASAPVYRPVPDAKGKGVDPLGSQALGGDIDPLLPPSPARRRSGARLSDAASDEEERLPLLEFGVIEMKTGEGTWR